MQLFHSLKFDLDPPSGKDDNDWLTKIMVDHEDYAQRRHSWCVCAVCLKTSCFLKFLLI